MGIITPVGNGITITHETQLGCMKSLLWYKHAASSNPETWERRVGSLTRMIKDELMTDYKCHRSYRTVR